MSFGAEHSVVVGAFTNIGAVAEYCRGRNVLSVCAGWEGHVCIEDALFGAALADRLSGSHTLGSDAVRMVLDYYRSHSSDTWVPSSRATTTSASSVWGRRRLSRTALTSTAPQLYPSPARMLRDVSS